MTFYEHALAAEKGAAESAAASGGLAEVPLTGIATWNDRQYTAWTMFGLASTMNAVYWLQNYYHKYWYASVTEYAAAAANPDASRGGARLINTYSLWGLANAINAIGLLIQWVPTALVWVITVLDIDELTWFYVMWCGVMHYVDALRFLVVAAIKTASYWGDRETDVTSYSGLADSYKVSKEHEASYWDFAVEWLGFVVSFGFYMDLHSTILKMPFIIKQQ
jgi:hypothetical protein